MLEITNLVLLTFAVGGLIYCSMIAIKISNMESREEFCEHCLEKLKK